jgi:hypothetical protein
MEVTNGTTQEAIDMVAKTSEWTLYLTMTIPMLTSLEMT